MTRTVPVSRQIAVAVGLLAVVAVIAVGGSFATMGNVEGWYADVDKVPWNPPGAVFGPAWSILYLLIALAGFLLWRSGRVREEDDGLGRVLAGFYIVQLMLNALWTPLFFAAYPLIGEVAWWLAMIDIVALIAIVMVLIALAARRSQAAALLLVPYLLWLVFAATLNAGIIALN
ncbi:TspO/MBR family protein [Microbacterium sp. gxy059]|uniref:TspO/MBR family protein n=1 Tax=Microbacterium sp. gxy059 TaxID=2957199 RepID=UPI003D98DD2C